ncbi:MAG: hypothetical protein VKK04_01495 [Synechococcales bacterium]|nr:hypothetical protein [Synechococcales bacterium]
MKTALVRLLVAIPIATAGIAYGTGAHAQEVDFDLEAQSIPEALEEAFFSNDEEFFVNRGIGRQLSWLLGFGFPENEIVRDGRALDRLYKEILEQQVSTTPLIRTPDLPNPYQTSVLLSPDLDIVVQEFEQTTIRQPIPAPAAPPQIVAPPPPPTPVPALW